MPAVSKAQQRLFGMVHAAQKGDLKNPFPEVKKMAATLKPQDAKDFASTSQEHLPEKVPQKTEENMVENVLETIAHYKQLGKKIKRESMMREIAEQINHIAEIAENTVVSEADDDYDAHTVKRHMGELKKYAGDFSKLAEEADMLESRMNALYEDAGYVLERYFEIPDVDAGFDDLEDKNIKNAQQNQREDPKPQINRPPVRDNKPVNEDDDIDINELDQKAQGDYDPRDSIGTDADRAVAENNMETHQHHKLHTKETNTQYPPNKHKMDEITTRIIKNVYNKLDEHNKEKFLKLSKNKMIRTAMRML